MIRCNVPLITEDEIDVVYKVFQSGNIAMGQQVGKFESLMERYCGREYAVAFHSATAAFDAYFELILDDGDEVIISPYTFHSVIYSIIRAGGKPIFIDINDDFLPDWKTVTGLLTERTKAVVVTHIFGKPDDTVWALANLGRACGFKVIEDCAQAIGARYLSGNVGSARVDASIFSFYATKNITSIEGGILVTDNPTTALSMQNLRNNGIVCYGDKKILGTNRRMSDIHATVGIEQMKFVDDVTEIRNTQADYYYELLGIDNPGQPYHGYRHAYHHFTILVDPRERMRIYNEMKLRGIELGMYYRYMAHNDTLLHDFMDIIEVPNADLLSKSCLQLPLGWNIDPEHEEEVVTNLKELYDGPINAA